MGVSTPPMEQAYAVISIRPVAYLYLLRSMYLPLAAIISRIASSRPSAIGNIMAAVAVLLIHPEQSMHASPMARNILRGESPTHFMDMMP